ncbi:MAG: acyl-CoA dehydratase activase-related protein [Candidatus Helarchaeota archaeon]|nr:acyl-CoA dehydratase activase-related protein [Candidatus Helarchaeota archaeon]
MIKIKNIIGIPRSLLYYKYFPLWKTFFEELDFEVVVSDKSNMHTVEVGGHYAIDEICIPLKLYFGHLVNLLEKKVDYLFVPRYISTTMGTYMCPKFLGLPDLVRGTMDNLPPIIEMDIDLRKKPKYASAIQTGRQLKRSLSQIQKAYTKAVQNYHYFRNLMVQGLSYQQAMNITNGGVENFQPKPSKHNGVKIGIIGHGYNIHDPYINMDLLKKLRKMNVQVITLENLPLEIFKERTIITNTLKNYWGNEEEILSAVNYLFKDKTLDGLIFICSFCCGPDSLIDELITRDAKKLELPYISLVLDEHSGQAGVITRVEAFVDMIIRKKRAEQIRPAQKIAVKPITI